MKKQIINRNHVEGYLYQHKLEKKISGQNSKNPGTEYITGTIDLATDDAMTNIVSIHFTYQTPLTKQNKENRTFKVLSNIIDGNVCSVMKDGADKAQKYSIDTAMDVNEWYSERNGTDELVSVMRNEGGFINAIDALNENEKVRATFETDTIINKVTHFEADPEKETPERAVISGYIMNFRGDFLPIKYTVLNPNAISYFEDLEASDKNPVFTKVRGQQVSVSVVRTVEEEGAFGEPHVREFVNSHKDFVVNWAMKEPYTIDDDEGADLTPKEIKKGLADRETALATKKKEQAEYKANKGGGSSAFATNTGEDFDF